VEIADVVLGAQNYEQDVRFNGETATFMGIWVLPTANSLEVIKRVRAAIPEIQSQLPPGMKAGIPYDSTAYIQDAINEVLSTLTETSAHRNSCHLLISGVVPLGADPHCRYSDFLDWRGFPDACGRLHHQPADPSGDRALGWLGGG